MAFEYVSQLFLLLACLRFLGLQGLAASRSGSRVRCRSLVFVSSLLVAYLICEGVFRTQNIVSPETQAVPTKSTRMWQQRYGALNKLGFRDKEFVTTTNPGEFRILVIGDSITYGLGIDNAGDRFTDILATQLRTTREFYATRVFNAGIGGANSADHLTMIRSLIDLRPNLVLLAYVFNDIEHLRPPTVHPAFHASSSYWARFGPHRLLMLNSHFFDQVLLRYRALQWQSRNQTAEKRLDAYGDKHLLRQHVDLLAEIMETVHKNGGIFRLVPFDVAVRRDPIYGDRYERFVEACVKKGLTVWSMRTVFDKLPYEALIVSNWDRHPNETAHRLVADFLTKRILEEKSLFSESPDPDGSRIGSIDSQS